MKLLRPIATFVSLASPLVAAASPSLATADPPDAQSRCLPTGPPPETGYERYEIAVTSRGQQVIAGVPSYQWRHGCGPTAAGMVIGYWDGKGYDQLVPGDASTQTSAVQQAIATSDGDSTHYSDYSLPLDSRPGPVEADRSAPPQGDEHASDSLADFMKTSWSSRNNYYGWSWFSDVDNALRRYTTWATAQYGATYRAHSRNEAGPGLGRPFNWAKFTAEIDAGRPMVFLVDADGDGYTDHFVTAIGYRDTAGYKEYACFDTWATGGSVRWEKFRGVSQRYDWGIYGATYFLIRPATETIRLGSPPNPCAFLPGQSSGPVIGRSWDPVVASFLPEAILDFVGIDLIEPVNVSTAMGTLLINPPRARQVFLNLAPGTPFEITIPSDPGLVGRPAWSQGGSVAPGPRAALANGLDIVFGTY